MASMQPWTCRDRRLSIGQDLLESLAGHADSSKPWVSHQCREGVPTDPHRNSLEHGFEAAHSEARKVGFCCRGLQVINKVLRRVMLIESVRDYH